MRRVKKQRVAAGMEWCGTVAGVVWCGGRGGVCLVAVWRVSGGNYTHT